MLTMCNSSLDPIIIWRLELLLHLKVSISVLVMIRVIAIVIVDSLAP